jgi:Transglutaminase-like enzymes, putative cysteine proteases
MSYSYLLFTGALRVFDNFSIPDCENFYIEHDTENPKFELLRDKYSLSEIAGNGNEFSKAVNLLGWVHNNVLHCGGGDEIDVLKDSLSILNYTYGNGKVPGIFCYHIAIVFTECCLALGLTARTIHCKPYSPNDTDTHVVSMVYINELNKWVFFDPNNNVYFADKNGTALSPLEARYLLARDEAYVVGSHQDEPDWYKEYMAKNLFYIKFWAKNTFGTDLVENQKVYYIAPIGFDVRDREIAYHEYAIKNAPVEYQKEWVISLNEIKKQQIIMVTEDQFLRKN